MLAPFLWLTVYIYYEQCCFVASEVQYGRTASVDDILEACRRNKVILKGIIASPLHSEEGILQTLNMKIRYRGSVTVDWHLFVENKVRSKLECGPVPNVMAALPNVGGALCSTPQSLADVHY